MANVKASRVGTKVITGKVRLSYEHLFEASAMAGNDPKFSVCVLISKDDTETISCVREAIGEAEQNGLAKLGGKIAKNIKIPLRDGDIDHEGDEAYENCYFLNASSKNRPGVVDANVQPIMDAEEVYSGCYARVSINFYAFAMNANKGIAAGLNNVQKLEEGEKLSGGASASADFGAVTQDFLA